MATGMQPGYVIPIFAVIVFLIVWIGYMILKEGGYKRIK